MQKLVSTIFIIIFLGFSLSISAQSNTKSETTSEKTVTKLTKKKKTKLYSAGIINGRALNLVRPDYPDAAKTTKLNGKVRVEVIIDTAGYVIEAKALKGHPLLKKPSLEAAKNSKFAPIFWDNKPIKVSGIIIYTFLPNYLNWLQIGFHAIETERIKDFLPANFREEKNLILKIHSTDTDYDPNGFKNLVSSIENKLRTDDKKLWLFQLGLTIRKLIDNQWNAETKSISLIEIQNLIYYKPQNTSPNLISKLEKLVKLNQENTELFNQELAGIIERFNILGK